MFNMNGPPGGANITADQSSYDLVYRDVIVNDVSGTLNTATSTWSYNLQLDNINNVYKVQLVTAAIVFSGSIPTNVINRSVIMSIPQLNGNLAPRVAGNISGSNSQVGSNSVISQLFAQIPDNCTPQSHANNTLSFYSTPSWYQTIQFYNPPVNKLNRIDVQWYDYTGAQIAYSAFSKFYFTLRVFFLQKRNNTSAISIPIVTDAGTGTLDSVFQPSFQSGYRR